MTKSRKKPAARAPQPAERGDATTPFPRSRSAAALFLVFLAALVFSVRPVTDSDFWHHLAFGRMLLEQGEFPRVDLLGSTSEGRPWVSSGWLPATALYALYRAAPQWGPQAFVVLLVVLQGLMLLGFALKRRVPPALAAFITVAALGACFIRFLPRPDLLSQIMLSALLLLLLGLDSPPAAPPDAPPAASLRRWLLVPLLFVAWANLHMLFPIGLFVLSLYIATALWKAARPHRRQLAARLGAIWILSLAACLISPNGWRAVWFIWENARLQDAGRRINELGPLWTLFGQPGAGATLLPLALWGAGAGALGVTRKLWRSASLWQVLTVIFFVILALIQRRQVALAVPGITLILLDLWPGHVRQTNPGRYPAQSPVPKGPFWQRSSAFALPVALLLGLWAFLVTNTILPNPLRTPARQWAGVNCDWYPCEAVPFLRNHPPPQRMFQDLYAGSFLAYQLWPDSQVFMDGRLEVYNNGTFDDFFAPPEGRMGALELFDKYQVRSALVDWRSAHEQPQSVAAVLSDTPGWRLCWFSDHYALFVREEPPGTGDDAAHAYAAEHGYHHLNPLRPGAFMEALVNPATAADAREDARRAIFEHPHSHLAQKAAEVAGLR